MRYKIRHNGTNEFVSGIVPAWAREEPDGLVYFVEGWDNPEAKIWENLEDAKIAEKEVWKAAKSIEGFPTLIEEVE